MFKKIILLCSISLISLAGCTTPPINADFVTGKYVYGKEGVGGKEFYIDFSDDNTFTYSEGDNCEVKSGKWEQNGKELALSVNDKKYYFEIPHAKLIVFENDKSDDFQNIDVLDSEKFGHVAYAEGNTVYMMSGNTFDFKTISEQIESISLIKATGKNNIEEEYDEQKDNTFKKIIYRSTGRITVLTLEDTKIHISQSDGEDEAEIEAVRKDGTKETYKIIYDCACK